MSRKRVPPIELLLILLILLLAFALRIHALDRQSFWNDEGLTVHYASTPATELVQRMRVGFHNPLFFLSLHFWMDASGSSDWGIRSYSLMFSMLAVPLIYALGRLLYGRTAGLLAALILAANPFAVYYAQEARMYAQVLALSTGMMLVFLLALRRDRLVYWLGFVLLAAGCLYTHYFAALAPLAAAVYYVGCWLSGRYRPLWGRWLLANAAVIVLYSPWLSNALGMTTAESWQEPTPPLSLPWDTVSRFSLGEVFPYPERPWLTLVYVLLFLLGCYAAYRWNRCESRGGDCAAKDTALLPVYFFVPLLAMVALAATARGLFVKYLTVALPPFCLFLALGVQVVAAGAGPSRTSKGTHATLVTVVRRSLAALSLAFILLSSAVALRAYFTDVRYFKPGFRATAAHITAFERPGDVILTDGINPDTVFQRYYDGDLSIHPVDLGEADEEEALLAQLTGTYDRAWLVLYFHEPGRIERWVEEHGYQLDRDEFSNVKLYLYGFPEHTGQTGWVSDPQQQTQGPARLARYRLWPDRVPSGGVAHLSLAWQVDQPPGVAYKVSVRLADSSGLVVWARDRFPIDGTVPSDTWQPGHDITDNLGIPVPAGTLPGTYHVPVVLYEAHTGREVVQADVGPLEVAPANADSAYPDLRIPPALASPVAFGEAVELLSREVPGGPVRAGSTMSLFLLWRASATPEETTAVFRLMDGSSVISEQRLDHSLYPTSTWREGELVRYPYRIRIEPAASSGEYLLTVNLVSSATGQALREHDLALGRLDVQSRPRNYDAPSHIAYPLEAQLGPNFRLLGYDLSPAQADPGSPVTLTLYWEALGPTDTDYTVFTHLLSPEGQLVSGQDTPPLQGEAPTTSWLPGEHLTDRYELTVPPDAPSGAYVLEIGMYDPITGGRLPVTLEEMPQPGDRLLLGTPVHVGQ